MSLVHPNFNPIAVDLGQWTILGHTFHPAVRWYGLMYLVAFIFVWLLGRWRIKHQPWVKFTARELEDLVFYGVLGVVLGGRLGYVLFYKLDYYLAHPAEIFAVWQGGMSFHGGFLGVLVAMWLFSR